MKALLNHIIPKFGVSLGTSSDKRPHFVVTVVGEVSRILGLTWDLHIPHRPQARSKAEHMNGTLKPQICKICQETSMTWVQALLSLDTAEAEGQHKPLQDIEQAISGSTCPDVYMKGGNLHEK